MLKPALIVLLVAAVLLALAWLAQRRLIYFPDRTDVPPAAEVLPQASDLTLVTSDGLRLGAWSVPPRAPPRGITVLVAAGNAGNRQTRAPLAEALADEGFEVLVFDYRGYGGNPGSPTEAGLARDVRAAYLHLVDEAAVPAERIIFFGESLGAGVVSELAAEHSPGGLVLRSPFTDLGAVGATHYPFLPVRLLLRDRYPVAEHVTRVDAPTAVVYGTADSIVPPEQSRQVAERAAGLVQVSAVAGADHNDYSLLAGPELVSAVVTVADEIGAP